MREETYGFSIIGLAAAIYGIVAWAGFIHAVEFNASAPGQLLVSTESQEILTLAANR